MRLETGRKLHKRAQTGNSVQTYACVCVCDGCKCVCNATQGGVMNNVGNKYSANTQTDANTKALNG